MMFFELDQGNVTLSDMKRIVNGLLAHKSVLKQLTPEQYQELAYIITPTLAIDQNEANIRAKFQQILQHFVIQGDKGQPMRFYCDDKFKRLYFGDAEGWQQAQDFAAREIDANLLKKHFPSL